MEPDRRGGGAEKVEWTCFRGGEVSGHSDNPAGTCVMGTVRSLGSIRGDSVVGVGVVGNRVCKTMVGLPGSRIMGCDATGATVEPSGTSRFRLPTISKTHGCTSMTHLQFRTGTGTL